MGRKGFNQAVVGMLFQAFSMIFIIGSLVRGEGALLLVGLLFFLPGIVIYWNHGFTLLTYVRDWVIVLLVMAMMMVAVGVMVLITGAESIPAALFGLTFFAALSAILGKLVWYMNMKCDQE